MPTITEARTLIASLNVGDELTLIADGCPHEVTVQRRSSPEPGGFGHPDSARVTVGYGPGRWNTELTAAGIAAGYLTVVRKD